MPSRRTVLKSLAVAPVAGLGQSSPDIHHVKQIDLIHHSHLDVGYTDLPSVCRELHVRFLDAALDATLASPGFCWTCEATVVVSDWWKSAPATRRDQFIQAIRDDRIDVMAMPFNQSPFLNEAQWQQALSWLPGDLWNMVRPRAAMQSDVNGMPRAGAMLLLDKGITRLLTGINRDSGGPPFRRPSAFWWKMPDGRRMFVWLGDHYGYAYDYLEPSRWLRGPARAANTALRPPREGEILRADEASVRAAHEFCLKKLRQLEADGYDYDRLILSVTNQWRWDNDPPFPAVTKFIDAWNGLDLQPRLHLTTATTALEDMERSVASGIPSKSGEWTDWWANGNASGPRELAASRFAKRTLAAATSPVWGQVTPAAKKKGEAILRDLCLFDEHTWGADVSVGNPESLETYGQYAEKSVLAYRPKSHAEWLLSQRAWTRLADEPEGLYVVNTAPAPYSGWATFTAKGLRSGARSLAETQSGATSAIYTESGNPMARFWVEQLPAASMRTLRLESRETADAPAKSKPAIELDARGWPLEARWPGMEQPLFIRGSGDFTAVLTDPSANRATLQKIHFATDPTEHARLRSTLLRPAGANPGQTTLVENAHTMAFAQPFQHPRIVNGIRSVELWKREARARWTVRFHRLSSLGPEIIYLDFAGPGKGLLPTFSNGGVPFVPFEDQLEGSCRDYFAIDGWAHYRSDDGDWLWVTRDAPLVTIGGPHPLMSYSSAPEETHRLSAMVFNNYWHTNFVADSHGDMEFVFDLVWRDSIREPAKLAATLVSEPVVVINPAARESRPIHDRLFGI